MSGGSEKELLHLAARESVERIRLDRVRATGRLRRFLDYLEPHLFDPELNVAHWKRASGVRSNVIEGQFHKQIGFTPYVYLTRARMQTAARLLSRTDLKIARIGWLVGIPDSAGFSRTFRRWAGMRPSQYRQRFQALEDTVISLRSELDYYCRIERRAMTNRGSVEELTKLVERLAELHPDRREPLGLAKKATKQQRNRPVEPEDLQRWRAEQIWLAMKGRSAEYQRDLMRSQIGMETRALFDLLRQKSREEGRKDRGRGVELAELALASLEVCDLEADLNLRVLGRVSLANARRLALDYLGAEREFTLAEAEWGFAGEPRDQHVEAQLFNDKADLLFYQRRVPEALQLVTEAVTLNRKLNRCVELARSLILRAAIQQYAGNPRSAIPDFEEALALLHGYKEVYLLVSGYTNLATAYLDLGENAAAREAAYRAEQLSQQLDFPLGQCQITWLAGRVEEAQGRLSRAINLFRKAQAGMIELGEFDYAALVSLDLAIVYAGEGRPSEVVELILPVVAILKVFKARREIQAALGLLQQAIDRNAVDVELLQMIRVLVTELLTIRQPGTGRRTKLTELG